MAPFLISLIILCLVPVCAYVCMRACLADMLEGKGLIMHILLVSFSILPAVLKWGPAKGVVHVYLCQDVRKIIFF